MDKLKLTKLPVSRILPNPSQPRKVFRQEELEALAQSIKRTAAPAGDGAPGKRGLLPDCRGAQAAGLQAGGPAEIPVLIADCEPEDSAVLALLENLQRQDLQMFEQANALASLLQEWHITQEEAAKRLGISQSYLANKLRLLKLSPQEQNEILEYKLTERHARGAAAR